MIIRPLWLDEAYTALLVRRPFAEIHHALRYDAGPPLYYDILRVWRFVAGESALSLRMISILFAMATTVLIYHLGLILFDRRTAIISSLFWICSPLAVSYACEARNYTLVAALTVVYGVCLTLFVVRTSILAYALSTAVLVVAVYTHNIAWFLMPAGFFTTLCFNRNRLMIVFLLISYFLAGLVYLPWVPVLSAQLANTGMTIGWIEGVWNSTTFFSSFSAFFPGGTTPLYINSIAFPSLLQTLNALLIGGSFLASIPAAVKDNRKELFFLSVFFLFGLLGPYVYSLFRQPIYLPGRTDFGFFPIGCLLLGYAVGSFKNTSYRFGFLSLLIFEMLLLVFFTIIREDILSEKEIVRYLQRYGSENDVVLCTGLTRPTLEYYLSEKDFIFLSFPQSMENHLAHINEEWYRENLDLDTDARQTMEEALNLIPKTGRLWVIASDRKINRPLFDLLRRNYRLKGNRIHTPSMGLRKLNEPIYIERYEFAQLQ